MFVPGGSFARLFWQCESRAIGCLAARPGSEAADGASRFGAASFAETGTISALRHAP